MTSRDVPATMRLQARNATRVTVLWQNVDLLLLILTALMLPFLHLLPVGVVRIPVGLFSVLLMPGYVLVESIFPRAGDLRISDRLLLSFGLSVALIPVFAMVLSVMPVGISMGSVSTLLAIWIIVVAAIAIWRRPVGHLVARLDRHGRDGPFAPGSPRVFGLALVAIVAAVVTVIWLPSIQGVTLGSIGTPEPTAFYMLGAEGRAEMYPTEVVVNQPVSIIVGIIHPASVSGTYRLEVRENIHPDVPGELLAASGPLTLAAGSQIEIPVEWTMQRLGDDQKVSLFLFSDGESTPIRDLALWINVNEPE